MAIWTGCQAVNAQPQSQSNLHREAMQALSAGDSSLAETLEQKAIEQNPRNATAHQGLAVIYAQQGKNAQAISEARKALTISPNSFTNCFNLAELLVTIGQPEEALIYFNKALSLNPSSESALIGKSNCLTKLGNPLAALELLEKANVKSSYQLQLHLAKTYFAIGDLDKSASALQGIFSRESKDYEAKLLAAQIEFQKRNLPAAVIMSDELIKSDPSHSGAYLLLSECFVITHSGLLNAVDLVQSAKKFAKNKAFVFSHLGLNFDRCASSTTKAEPDYDEKKYAWRILAEECWRQAVKASPANGNFRYHFAISLKKNRKLVEAYYQVNKCLEIDLQNKDALLLKDKLKQAKYDLLGWLQFYTSGREL